MAYSHCMGPGQVQGVGPGLMGPNVLCRNVHTGPGQGQEPDSLSLFVPILIPVPVLVAVLCSVIKPSQSNARGNRTRYEWDPVYSGTAL